MIGEPHCFGDGAMSGALGDQPVHLLADPPIRRVALRRRPQFDDMHCLACVHPHVEADPERHGNGVLRHERRRVVPREAIGQTGGIGHHAFPVAPRPGAVYRLRPRATVPCRQRLPVEGEQAMALEVAERAVVRQDVERVLGVLERPSGTVTPIGPLAV